MTDSAPLDLFLAEFWPAFESAESSGDFSRVGPMCAENLTFQSPAEEPYESLERLAEAWWSPPADYQIRFDHDELVAVDRLAIQRGIAMDRFTDGAGEVRSHRYNYLAVFGRQGSAWRLTHFISNVIA